MIYGTPADRKDPRSRLTAVHISKLGKVDALKPPHVLDVNGAKVRLEDPEPLITTPIFWCSSADHNDVVRVISKAYYRFIASTRRPNRWLRHSNLPRLGISLPIKAEQVLRLNDKAFSARRHHAFGFADHIRQEFPKYFYFVRSGWSIPLMSIFARSCQQLVSSFTDLQLRRCFPDHPNPRSSHLQPTPRGGWNCVRFVALYLLFYCLVAKVSLPWHFRY